MASLNKVFLLGNLTRDPDLRYLPSGAGVCELGLAVNRRYTNSNGESIEEPCFVDVVVWGKSADNCKQYLQKGSQVMVEGRLHFEQWEDRNGGGKRSRLRVVAEQVQFMNRRPAEGYGPDNGGAYGDAPMPQAPQQRYSRPAAPGGMPRQAAAPGGMPRQAPPPGAMPRAAAPAPAEMPPMPSAAFNPDEGMEDDIPF